MSATAEQRTDEASPEIVADGYCARRLDGCSPVPLYHQVYSALLDEIRDGRLRRGDILPTEAELGAHFQVSRITIRQALADLIRDGHLVRERPRGPLVIKSAPIEQRLARLTSFFIADALAQGHSPQYRLLGAACTDAEGQASALGLDKGDAVTRIDRILLDADEPIATLTSYVPERCCPGLLDHDLTGSLVTLMETHYGLRLTEATQWLSARLATVSERATLALESRAAVVVIKRLTRGHDGQPIEFLECVLRADRYEFVMELSQK
jgi:GntR family transcriptional regulator